MCGYPAVRNRFCDKHTGNCGGGDAVRVWKIEEKLSGVGFLLFVVVFFPFPACYFGEEEEWGMGRDLVKWKVLLG